MVYYLRFGDRIKIGTTTNIVNRLAGIPHDELLAVEPGSYAREAERHREFKDDWIVGEITYLRDRHGAQLMEWIPKRAEAD